MFLSIVRKRKHKQQLLYYILASISLLLRLYFPPRTISLREYKAMQKKNSKKRKKKKGGRKRGSWPFGCTASASITLSPHLCTNVTSPSESSSLSTFVFVFPTFKHIHFAPRVLFFKRLSLSLLRHRLDGRKMPSNLYV